MLADKDPAAAGRVMKAMMEMDKIDIAALRKRTNPVTTNKPAFEMLRRGRHE